MDSENLRNLFIEFYDAGRQQVLKIKKKHSKKDLCLIKLANFILV